MLGTKLADEVTGIVGEAVRTTDQAAGFVRGRRRK